MRRRERAKQKEGQEWEGVSLWGGGKLGIQQHTTSNEKVEKQSEWTSARALVALLCKPTWRPRKDKPPWQWAMLRTLETDTLSDKQRLELSLLSRSMIQAKARTQIKTQETLRIKWWRPSSSTVSSKRDSLPCITCDGAHLLTKDSHKREEPKHSRTWYFHKRRKMKLNRIQAVQEKQR